MSTLSHLVFPSIENNPDESDMQLNPESEQIRADDFHGLIDKRCSVSPIVIGRSPRSEDGAALKRGKDFRRVVRRKKGVADISFDRHLRSFLVQYERLRCILAVDGSDVCEKYPRATRVNIQQIFKSLKVNRPTLPRVR